ncbi:DNA polymerase, partial [Salmonella sp. SAL4457]|uniref:DNA polymerase n=1 Tax=Salmonella sp. SAL4457 TaxID=3159912 RepID=UPI003977E870
MILHKILIEIRNLVQDNWSLNIEKCPTISSLSYAIFRTKYLLENMIPITSTNIFSGLKILILVEVLICIFLTVEMLKFMTVPLYIPHK